MKRAKQISESIELGAILSLSGGFMDAYSYMCRGEVFANAQTGNMLLFGIRLSEGNFSESVAYLLPILAFAFGIMLASILRFKLRDGDGLHWRQFCVAIEILALTSVAFITPNLLANSLISLACGVQVESFRTIHEKGFATTMCIGNLRNATNHFCAFWHTKERHHLFSGVLYFGVIACFVLGAVIGNQFVKLLGQQAILIGAVLLAIAFGLMFIDREKQRET